MTIAHPDYDLHQRFIDRAIEAMDAKPNYNAISPKQLGRIRLSQDWRMKVAPEVTLYLQWDGPTHRPNMLLDLPDTVWAVPFTPKGADEIYPGSIPFHGMVALWRDAFRLLMASDLPDQAFRSDLRRIAAMTVLFEEFSRP